MSQPEPLSLAKGFGKESFRERRHFAGEPGRSAPDRTPLPAATRRPRAERWRVGEICASPEEFREGFSRFSRATRSGASAAGPAPTRFVSGLPQSFRKNRHVFEAGEFASHFARLRRFASQSRVARTKSAGIGLPSFGTRSGSGKTPLATPLHAVAADLRNPRRARTIGRDETEVTIQCGSWKSPEVHG